MTFKMLSMFIALTIVLGSCTKPACGTAREKQKKIKKLRKNGAFNM